MKHKKKPIHYKAKKLVIIIVLLSICTAVIQSERLHLFVRGLEILVLGKDLQDILELLA